MPFETDFLCTLKDLKKVNRARNLATLKSNWILFLASFVGIPIILNAQGIIEGDKASIFTAVTGPFLLAFVYFLVIEMVTKMQFKKNQTTGSLNIHFTFYDDAFQMENPLVKNLIRYDALHSIEENKDFFFLKLAPSKMVVVQKQNCSPQLISFIQEKAAVINSRKK